MGRNVTGKCADAAQTEIANDQEWIAIEGRAKDKLVLFARHPDLTDGQNRLSTGFGLKAIEASDGWGESDERQSIHNRMIFLFFNEARLPAVHTIVAFLHYDREQP